MRNDEKNYFTLKSLFVLKVFKFWSFWSCRKRHDWKDKLLPKFVIAQPGKQAIAMHILLNISKVKGNQTMKFDQLIEHKHEEHFS